MAYWVKLESGPDSVPDSSHFGSPPLGHRVMEDDS